MPPGLSAGPLILETPLAQEQFFEVFQMPYENFSSGPQNVCRFFDVEVVVREDGKADGEKDWERSETEE